MIDPVTAWFKTAQYDDKIAISISKLVETTWMSRYSGLIEITYNQGKECIGHEFRKFLFEEEYGITAKPITSENPMSNAVLEWIHQVLGNIVRNF